LRHEATNRRVSLGDSLGAEARDGLLTGYRHPAYAKSLAEFGEPRELPCSGGWLLERTVPRSTERDAMGCYPIFSAGNWPGLAKDLAELGPRLISVALVADPFDDYTPEQLSSWFDRVVGFKEHYVVDFSAPLQVSKHHSYYARKAAREVRIEAGPPPKNFAQQWTVLYEALVQRHGLKGIKAFSRAAFEVQMDIPGMIVFRALEKDSLVGAHLWYEQRGVAYSHLAAATERGYDLNCSYAIYAAVLEYFRPKVRWVNFGAGAGTANRQNGLGWFKEGWSNGTRTTYFCGRILNRERYDALVKESQKEEETYFPAYRAGELG
jgi:hypothetical protein